MVLSFAPTLFCSTSGMKNNSCHRQRLFWTHLLLGSQPRLKRRESIVLITLLSECLLSLLFMPGNAVFNPQNCVENTQLIFFALSSHSWGRASLFPSPKASKSVRNPFLSLVFLFLYSFKAILSSTYDHRTLPAPPWALCPSCTLQLICLGDVLIYSLYYVCYRSMCLWNK